MTREEFVERMVRKAVVQSASACLKQLQHPSGRKPAASRVEESKWFNGLNDSDKVFVERCLMRAADMALFSVFTILDGVSFIEDIGPKGEFKLYFEKDGQTLLLNPEEGEMLHDLMPAPESQ